MFLFSYLYIYIFCSFYIDILLPSSCYIYIIFGNKKLSGSLHCVCRWWHCCVSPLASHHCCGSTDRTLVLALVPSCLRQLVRETGRTCNSSWTRKEVRDSHFLFILLPLFYPLVCCSGGAYWSHRQVWTGMYTAYTHKPCTGTACHSEGTYMHACMHTHAHTHTRTRTHTHTHAHVLITTIQCCKCYTYVECTSQLNRRQWCHCSVPLNLSSLYSDSTDNCCKQGSPQMCQDSAYEQMQSLLRH